MRAVWEAMQEADEELGLLKKVLGAETRACFCVGPRPGQSRCPCQQRAYDAEKTAMRKEILDELGLSAGGGTGI